MRTAAIAFVLSTACAALLTPAVRTLALRLGVLDHALSSRKIHGRPVPRLGGIAIVVAFFAPLLGLVFLESDVGRMFLAERNQALGLFVGGFLIALLGVYDDLWGAGATRKFIVQFAVAGLLYYLGFRIDVLANPFGEPVQLGWAGLPFTLLWMVGVVNAMNLIDGLDGLAGGVGLVAVITTFLVALQRGHPLMILFCAALGGAILGFLFYNFNPASIFMGDTGSMFIGFVLAAAAIQTNQKSSTAVAVIIPAIALGLPILDTILAMSRRAVRGRPLFRADKEHIHHRLIAVGLSHRQAVLVLYGLCLIFGGVALALTYATSSETAAILIVLGILAFLFLRWLGYIQLSQMLPEQRRRSRALRAAVRPFADRLRRATNLDEVWGSVQDVMGVVAAKCARLDLSSRTQNGRSSTPVTFTHGYDEAAEAGITANLFRARFILVGVKPDDGAMEFAWDDGRRALDRDTEIAIELFCDYLSQACDRVRGTGDSASLVKDSGGKSATPA